MFKNNFQIIKFIAIIIGALFFFEYTATAQVEKIDVQSIYKNPNGYCEYQVLFKAKIPAKLTVLPDFESNAQALYNIDSIEVIEGNSYAVYNVRLSIPTYRVVNGFTTVNLTTQTDVQNRLHAELLALETKLNALIPYPFGIIKEQIYLDSTWVNQ